MSAYIPAFGRARVLVIGDVMLDRYWHGATSRISPEAPVPVVHIDREEERPGGAGNVAIDIVALCAQPYLLGTTGDDTAANSLENRLSAAGVQCRFQRVPVVPTVTKLRVLSSCQGLTRDLTMRLSNFDKPWRVVTEHRRRGASLVLLINDLSHALGEIDFSRVCNGAKSGEIGGCVDTWKNDLDQAKTWAKRLTAIDIQPGIAAITQRLACLLIQRTLGTTGSQDPEFQSLQARREAKVAPLPDGTDRHCWNPALFRSIAQASGRLLRFLNPTFLQRAASALTQGQLKPLLRTYL